MELIELREYLWAWLVYIAGCVVLLSIGWGWTRNLPWLWLKNSLRLGVAALLLTPIPHEDAAHLWVPAVIVAGLGWLTGDEVAAVSALTTLAGVLLGSVLVAIGLAYMLPGKAKAANGGAPANGDNGSNSRIEPTMADKPAAGEKPPA